MRPLVLEECFFDEAVRLDEARAPRVALKGCRLSTLSARQFESRGDLTLDGLIGARRVVLAGARIGGALTLRNAQLKNEHGVVLDAERLAVHIAMDCTRLHAIGELRLLGAHIGGHLTFAGARLSNEGRLALNGDGLQVGQDMRCDDADGQRFEATGEVRLLGAQIGGVLSFIGARLSNENGPALTADLLQVDQDMLCQTAGKQRFEATGEVRLLGAHIGGQLSFRGACVSNKGRPALSADQLKVDQEMLCEALGGQRFEATGGLRLPGAHIGGVLSFIGARLSNENGPALTADCLHVDRSMLCYAAGPHRFEAIGELRLLGAHIAGDLTFLQARLSNKDRPALTADGLHVDRSMLCYAAGPHRFEATGQLRLVGAHIGGQVSFAGARLSNQGAPALIADWLKVGQSMLCYEKGRPRFEASGELRLPGAHIGGQLSFAGAQLSSSEELALDLESVEARELWLPGDHAPEGTINLTDAEVGQLHDDWRPQQAGSSSHQYRLRLSGFVYESLGTGSDQCEARLDWLLHAEEGYLPQGYDQLAAVFRRAGREEDAWRVAIAKQRVRRRTLPVGAKAASYLLDVAVGYGYRTWRAMLSLAAIVLIGWAVFEAAFPKHMRATRPASQLPPFHAWLYSIDAVLPLINLGQKSAWTPTGPAQIWYAFSVLAGWVLGLGLVAYFTAKLFRE